MKSVFCLFTVLIISSIPLGLQASSTPICKRQVLKPAITSERNEQVNVVEGSNHYELMPTELGTSERKVKTKDGYISYEVIPATFKQVTETIEVERERIELETLPAQYTTETKRVKVKEATQRWNPACLPIAEDAALPAYCLLSEPAEYQTITRKIIKIPARTIKKVIPAKIQTITRQVIDQPAQLVRKQMPAEYTTVNLQHVIKAAGTRSIPIPNENQVIETEVVHQAARVESLAAWCEDQVSVADGTSLQQRLKQLGYYKGAVNGIYNPQTRQALTEFQQANQLASGAITLESLRKLGLY
jgi:hypothetical protein